MIRPACRPCFTRLRFPQAMKHLRQARKYAHEEGAILIGSISDMEGEALTEIAQMHEDVGCDMLEYMFSCPNLEGSDLVQDEDISGRPDLWVSHMRKLREAVRIPISCKISPENGTQGIMDQAKAVKEAGIGAVTIADRMQSLEVDLETGRPLLCGGFSGVDVLPAFERLWENNKILGLKDFGKDGSNILRNEPHGMYVLSIMAGFIPDAIIGVAPDASYWLLRTEINYDNPFLFEYRIEEDNWVAAAEFADSAGVDIINTSLGYNAFSDPDMNYSIEDMDGKTSRMSISVFFSCGGRKPE